MKKTIYISILLILQAVLASCNMFDNKARIEHLASWMEQLSDTTYVCKLSIPGTHDTFTGEYFVDQSFIDEYTTQTAHFTEQLTGGIRYFDVRLVLGIDDEGSSILQISHRTALIDYTFEQALLCAQTFLTENPSEFLIMKIQYDGGPMTDTEKATWRRLLQDVLTDRRFSRLFADFRPDLTVGDMRGKILLISRTEYGTPVKGALTNWTDEGRTDTDMFFPTLERTLTLAPTPHAAVAFQGEGTPHAARLYVQDYYNTIGDRMDMKLRAVEAMYKSAQETPADSLIWIINHVSGFSTPCMNAIGYAENASHANTYLLNLLQADETSRPVGIIAMDYACTDTLDQAIGNLGTINRRTNAQSLTQAVILQNFK